MNSKIIVSTLLASMTLVSLQVSATELKKGSWIVRAGAAVVAPNDDSGSVTGIPDSGVSVGSNTQLGLTVTYMLKENLGIGVLAATPFKHDIYAEGSIAGLGKIADVRHLPPTLTLQYHFQNTTRFKPYFGAGINFTTFFSEDVSPSLEAALGGPTDLSLSDSFGFALEAGIDIEFSDGWYFNLAGWYLDIDTTAKLNTGGTQLSVDVGIDPWVWMAGISKQF